MKTKLKQITHSSQLVGKTISGVADESDDMVLVFTDGTWALICGYDADDNLGAVEVVRHQHPNTGSAQSLVAAGWWTAEECAAWRQEREATRAKVTEDFERQTYERLKAKFGGGS